MPTLDFPNNPLPGDQFVGSNGAIYQWDGTAWNLGSIIPGTAAGGDLTGSYPNPDIAPGVVGTVELQTNVVNRLTPTPTMPADASKVLTVTPITGVPAWQVPTAGGTGWWNDNSVHATLKPATTGRSIELDSQTALWFGDSTTPCPAVRTPNQDIFVQSAVGRTAWLQSGQSGGVLGLTPSSASLNVDLLCQGGLQIAQFKGASPSSGSLSFVANQLLLRVAGAWQTVYPAGGGSGGIPEAPSDGTIYGRQNASWTAVVGGGGPPSGVAAGDLGGTYPNPTVVKSAGAFTANGAITALGSQDQVVWGTRTIKGRLSAAASVDYFEINTNATVASVQDDVSKSSWRLRLRPDSDRFEVLRNAPGGSAVAMLTVDSAGNLTTAAACIVGTNLNLAGGTLTASFGNAPVAWGNGTVKGRLINGTAVKSIEVTANCNNGGTQDDATAPSWRMMLDASGADSFKVNRQPAGSTTPATLLTLDATGQLTLPTSGANGAVIFGSRTAKGRLVSHPTTDSSYLMHNVTLNPAGSGYVQDDNTKSSWFLAFSGTSGGDACAIQRIAAGGAVTSPMLLDNSGNLIILGGNAQKASGTTWANPSDRRLKDAIADYTTGLDAILQLQPRTFVYNGKGGSTAGARGYSFIADEIAPVMPETVSTQPGKLNPGDKTNTGIQILDQSNIVLALVNATKELAARVTALESGS